MNALPFTRQSSLITDFEIVRIGTGLRTADDFRKAFEEAGCSIGTEGNHILAKPGFTVSPEMMEVEFNSLSASELGFKFGGSRRDIYARAKEIGCHLCSDEFVLQFCLQYTDQPNKEVFLVATEPIVSHRGTISIHCVERWGGKRLLRGRNGDPDHVFGADSQWIFQHKP